MTLVPVWCALVAPGLLIFWRLPAVGSPAARIVAGLVAGVAIAIQEARLAAFVDLALFPFLHLTALVGASVFFFRYRSVPEAPSEITPPARGEHAALVLILAACFVSRLIPVLLTGLPPGIDPCFHLLIVRKLILTGRLLGDWMPFEPVAVNYPQGTHLLVAVLSKFSTVEPHDAFKFGFPVVAPLISGMVWLVARDLFGSSRIALTAALVHAFAPRWASLGDFGWGGLPNMTGTLIGLLVIRVVLTGRSWPASLGGGLLLATVPLAHNHAALVTVLILITLLIGNPGGSEDSRRIRANVLRTGMFSALFGADMILHALLNVSGDAAAQSLFQFWEPPIMIHEAMMNLGLPVSLPAAAGVILLLRSRPDNPAWFLLIWTAALLVAFVVLEYVYRLGVFLIRDQMFSALTPSRFFSQLAVPGSILAAVALVRGVGRVPSAARPVLCAAFALMLAAHSCRILAEPVPSADRLALEEDFRAAMTWIRENTEPDAFVFEVRDEFHRWTPYQTWTSYLTWRETNFTPLPVSEARNDPRVLYKDAVLRSDPGEFDRWRIEHPRPLYRVADGYTLNDPALEPVHSHARFTIYRWRPESL